MANSRGWRIKTRSEAAAKSASDSQEVARLAYHLYEQRGRLDGHDLDDWLRAEGIVRRQKGARNVLSFG